jgi:phage terminase large subunit-like protein
LHERERLLGGKWNARPSAGKIFNRAWVEIVAAAPLKAKRGRGTGTKAGTEGGGKRTAGVKMSRSAETGLFYLEDVVAGQWGAMRREEVIQQTAELDGPDVEIWIEQEPGSGGKESAESTIRNLTGYTVHADGVSGNKIERAGPRSAQTEAGKSSSCVDP